MSQRMPTLYLPHGGGPCFFMDWTMGPADTWEPLRQWLSSIPESLPIEASALLVISAHWEEPAPRYTALSRPPLLFDYQGFPQHTYELTWPAPGSPKLGRRMAELMAGAGIECQADDARGFDHGVFVPLKVAFPNAEIPTVALSLVRGLDPEMHLKIGRALAPLRDEGVLIIGSGMSYHNMRGFMGPRAGFDSAAFDAWLARIVAEPERERSEHLERWAVAPSGRESHPREEHLLPLHVAAGAAGSDAGRVVFTDEVMGARVSAIQFG